MVNQFFKVGDEHILKKIKVLLVVSLIANIYLFNELYKANQIDKVASSNNFSIWETRYQMVTNSLGRVLEDPTDQESYHSLLDSTEFLRVYQTVPMNNYYGLKNGNELGRNILELTGQIVDVVYENFNPNKNEDLTTEQLDQLEVFQKNLELLAIQFNNILKEVRESRLSFKEYQLRLSSAMEETIHRNKMLFQ